MIDNLRNIAKVDNLRNIERLTTCNIGRTGNLIIFEIFGRFTILAILRG